MYLLSVWLVLLWTQLTAAAPATNTPPFFTSCPSSTIRLIAEPKQIKVKAEWNVPSGTDRETPDKVRVVKDPNSPAPGDMLARGPYIVKYRIYDNKNAEDECIFRVEVSIPRCPPITGIPNGRSSCFTGSTYGQECTTKCNPGFEVLGATVLTCQKDNTYDNKYPSCEVVDHYQAICRAITQGTSTGLVSSIDFNLNKLLERLQREFYLPFTQGFEAAKEKCKDPKKSEFGACIWLRRYALFERLKPDIANFSKEPANNLAQDKEKNFAFFTYRRLMMSHPYISSFCQSKAFVDELYADLPNLKRMGDSSYISMLGSLTEAFPASKTPVLRKEAEGFCSTVYKDPKCLLKDLFGIIDRTRLFLVEFHENNTIEDKTWYSNGITFNSIILKWKYGSHMYVVEPRTYKEHQVVATEIVKAIAKYVDEGLDNKVITLMSMFPILETDKVCEYGTMCLFWRVVDQSHAYVLSRKKKLPGAVDVRIINSQLDKREFLQQKQMERILQLLVDNQYNLVKVADDLKKEFNNVVNQRFNELKTYFKKVHKFSADIAAADMIVLHQIANLTKTARADAKQIDISIGVLLAGALGSSISTVVTRAIILVSVTSESCNPIDPSPSDIQEALSALMNAIANLIRAIRLIETVRLAINHSQDLQNKFKQNKKFIDSMNEIKNTIINGTTNSKDFRKNKDIFLELYNGYIPSVTKPDVTLMGSYYTQIVDTSCDIIKTGEGKAAEAIKLLEAGSGTCSMTRIKIDVLSTTYEEIHDKQYELVNVILANVQAQVALEAAEGIVTDFDDLAKKNNVTEDVLESIKQTAAMSYVVYRIMVIQVIRLYCDELEYQNGGVRPSICRDSRTDVATLLAYQLSPCHASNSAFQVIPNYRFNVQDTAFLKLQNLYSGRPSFFKIPDHDWLIKYKWITEADKNSVLYVESFEVYLPSEFYLPRTVRVQVQATGENELFKGGKRYSIRPERPMVFEYTIGDLNCRRMPEFNNPYTTCFTDKLSKICPHTEKSTNLGTGFRRRLNPSVLSFFKVIVNGYEDVLWPEGSTPIPIQVGIKLCVMMPEGSKLGVPKAEPSRVIPTRPYSNGCCPPKRYWDVIYKECASCPEGSEKALRGYYCKKPRPAILFRG